MRNSKPKISVIVPVYNVEQYLPRCIDSILAQTVTNFELLLIDDGSKDNSSKICDEYAEKNKHIHVFHKKNGGVSSARNVGLENAKGEWIAFIDSDDYIKNDYLESFFKYGKLDLYTHVIQGFYVFDNKGIINNTNKSLLYSHYKYINIKSNKYNPAIEKYRLFQRTEVWGKLFSLSLIKSNNIRFDERIKVYEDGIFWHTYLLYIKTIILIPERGYYYYYPPTSNSLMHTHKFTIDERLSILEHTSILQSKLITHFALKGDYAKDIYDTFLKGYRNLYINENFTYVQYKRLQLIKPSHIKYIRNLKDLCFCLINKLPLKWYLIIRGHLIK